MSIKNSIGYLIRRAGLANFADLIRFNFKKIINHKKNRIYKKQHPNLILPPDYFVYETYTLNHKEYFTDGFETAKELLALINKYSSLNDYENKMLDWGCGPARIIRHFPIIEENKLKPFGTDYNSRYIKWNKENIHGVTFIENRLDPPLDFANNYFAVIYGLSIITHLSAEKHISWIKEMHRLLQPNGLLILTSQGEAFKNKLTKKEQRLFANGDLIVHSKSTEGSRTFSAFQPETFMKKLFSDFEIVAWQNGKEDNGPGGLQDTWVVKKL